MPRQTGPHLARCLIKRANHTGGFAFARRNCEWPLTLMIIVATPLRRGPDVHALTLRTDKHQHLHAPTVGTANGVRHGRVELGGVSR